MRPPRTVLSQGVTCPKCKATPGQSCQTPGKRPRTTHDERRTAWFDGEQDRLREARIPA